MPCHEHAQLAGWLSKSHAMQQSTVGAVVVTQYISQADHKHDHMQINICGHKYNWHVLAGCCSNQGSVPVYKRRRVSRGRWCEASTRTTTGHSLP